jgi:outer membrane lipoprotein SlyB
MFRTVLTVLAIAGTLFAVAACGSSQGSKTYSRREAQQQQQVYEGTVLRVENVTIEGESTALGAVGGGFLGYALGSAVGGGSGNRIAKTAGAVGGVAAGSAVEKNARTSAGLEIEVELDNGDLVVVVQEKDDEFMVGDRVRLIRAPNGVVRVRQ